MREKVFMTFLLALVILRLPAQDLRSRWVDSVFNTLSREQKIGQLFMIPVSSYASSEVTSNLSELIKTKGVGGIYVTQGGPVSHAKLVNKLQSSSKVPLLVAVSAEWGLAQTMDSTMGFQKPMVASAWADENLSRRWGNEIARQMRMLGFHVNFAPHMDDEIFEDDYQRYFSNIERTVARQSVAFTHAMREQGILSVARHLPREKKNHRVDSTLVLNVQTLDTTGLLPLQELIRAKVDGIMTNHLHFSVRTEKGISPAALSSVFVSDILKKKLGYEGLVFSDVNSFAVTIGKSRDGDAEIKAFTMGNDVLLSPLHLTTAIRKITRLVKKDKLLQQQLDLSVRKILTAKYNAGLKESRIIDIANLNQRLHSPEAFLLKDELAAASPTVLVNQSGILPIRTLDNQTFECISLGRDLKNEFEHYLEKFVPIIPHSVRQRSDTTNVSLQKESIIFVGVFHPASDDAELASWINRIASTHKVIVVSFAHPGGLTAYSNAAALIAAYSDQDLIPSKVPQVIFGALPGIGEFPLALEGLPGRGLNTDALDRLTYSVPEAAGVDSRTLDRILPIMNEAIASGATPGCQVVVAKDGKIIYERSAGTLTYTSQVPVSDETIYDLASLTKVTATLQTVMFMQEHRLIDLDKKASVYLPELKESNKKDFTLRDILTHQAGLWPFLPFWAQTMKDSVHLPEFYSYSASESYPYPVAADLYASKAMKDSLWQWIVNARVREKPSRTPYDYRYSDMGFYILQHLAEKLLNQPMEDFLAQNIYEPLGAYTTGFLPLDKFSASRVAPTEDDKLFRKKLLTGYVHDQGAAMHGGIAGHAGLFSTANDLAKLGQMWLQNGHYGGTQYFKPATLNLFTQRQFENSRRGIGWDKPPIGDWSGPTSLKASPLTFGHTGFTGTCVWVDPQFNLVFIFLSNRVHPDMNNNKLLNANIRPRVQDVVYQAIFNYCATHD